MNPSRKIWIVCLFGFLLMASPAVFGEETDLDAEQNDGEDGDYPDDDASDGDGLPPIITSVPDKITQVEGTKFELKCKGEHFENWGVMWNHGEKMLAAAGHLLSQDRRIHLMENHSLIIENANIDDSGIYACKLWDNVTVEHVVFITEQGKAAGMPHVLLSNKVLIVNQGEPVSLTCYWTGTPEPVVKWIREGKKAFPDGKKQIEGSTITFPSVDRHHSGLYECNAVNSVGHAVTALQLEVNFAPEIQLQRDSVHSRHGAEAELICTVHAEPKPTSVVWLFNGQPIKHNFHNHGTVEQHQHAHTLHIQNVTEKDYGDYKCVAENRLGSTSAIIQLTGAPSQPHLDDGTTRTGSEHMSYRLVWTVESSIPIEDFKLSFRKGDEEWQNISVKGEQNPQQTYGYIVDYTLRKLVSNSDYEIVLSAMNKFGWSRPSRIHKVHINGKNYQTLNYEAEEAAKASEVAGSRGNSLISVSTSSFVWFLVLSFWLRQ